VKGWSTVSQVPFHDTRGSFLTGEEAAAVGGQAERRVVRPPGFEPGTCG